MMMILGPIKRGCQVMRPVIMQAQRAITVTAVRRAAGESGKDELVLRTDHDHGTTVLTLNNPRKMNILSLEMLTVLRDKLKVAMDTDEVKSIIIAHKGVCFSSGHDLKELQSSKGTDRHQSIFDTCTEVMKLLEDSPVPTIAQVNGLATAAGCQMVASCDIAISSDKSQFALPGVQRGLFCSTPAVAVGRHVPRKVVMHMLFTGDNITAQEALMHGLVSKVTSEENLESLTMETAARIGASSKAVKTLGKAAFKRQIDTGRDEAYCIATDAMMENLRVVDCQEGINAFAEKRQATWNHKYQLLPTSNTKE